MLKHGLFSFHILDFSPWPLFISSAAFQSLIGTIESINFSEYSYTLMLGNLNFILIFIMWMRDITRESTFQGNHTLSVTAGLKMGMILFIISEVFFFFSFFWGLIYLGVSPSHEVYSWPPVGLMCINYTKVPLLGTVVLITSGVTVTIAHNNILKSSYDLKYLLLTILFGLSFTSLQLLEYYEASFTISDSSFGSFFFMATGFHGFHVIMGTLLLLGGFIRLFYGHYSSNHHFGFEAAAWYWHFVDVVWLFLYVLVYWWGSAV